MNVGAQKTIKADKNYVAGSRYEDDQGIWVVKQSCLEGSEVAVGLVTEKKQLPQKTKSIIKTEEIENDN